MALPTAHPNRPHRRYVTLGTPSRLADTQTANNVSPCTQGSPTLGEVPRRSDAKMVKSKHRGMSVPALGCFYSFLNLLLTSVV